MEINFRKALKKKVQLVCKLKMIRGFNYLKSLLLKYQFTREIFNLELEQGDEVFIPKELS
jgi:hypothetical protein